MSAVVVETDHMQRFIMKGRPWTRADRMELRNVDIQVDWYIDLCSN